MRLADWVIFRAIQRQGNTALMPRSILLGWRTIIEWFGSARACFLYRIESVARLIINITGLEHAF